MRHRKSGRKLSRSSSHRQALLRNMATSLILREQYETTVEKAKELRPVVERLITKAKKDTLAARRLAFSYLREKKAVHKLFADVAKRFMSRPGGYTRIIRTRIRPGDAANMAMIVFVAESEAPSAKKTATKKTRKTSKVEANA